jgi:hypothetical protein
VNDTRTARIRVIAKDMLDARRDTMVRIMPAASLVEEAPDACKLALMVSLPRMLAE